MTRNIEVCFKDDTVEVLDIPEELSFCDTIKHLNDLYGKNGYKYYLEL